MFWAFESLRGHCVCVCSIELHLSIDHIKDIIGILQDFTHLLEHGIMVATISKLKMDLNFDSLSSNQIHWVLFGFQGAVSAGT